MLNDKLINENEKIIKELDNEKKLINEYESKLDKLNYNHNQKAQKIAKELNDNGILINKLSKLNNEHEQIVQEIRKQLNDKNVSLDEYEKKIITLNNTHKKKTTGILKKIKRK